MSKATMILKSSAIFNGYDETLYDGGVVINGEKIVGIFPEEELSGYIGEDTKVYDCKDKLIAPGLHDSHVHIGMGSDFMDEDFCVDLDPAVSFADAMEILKQFGESHPDNKIIFGINFNYLKLSDKIWPDRYMIDEYISERPVAILTWDVHTFFGNSKAVKLFGMDENTPDPDGGICKFEDGTLSGVYRDTAAFKVQRFVLDRPVEDKKKGVCQFMRKCNKYGLTSLSEVFPCGNDIPYPMWKEIEDVGELTTRITFYPNLMDFTLESVSNYQKNYNSSWLQFAGLKVLMDGVITAHTAWMQEPYSDTKDNCGFPAIVKERVKEKLLEAHKNGISVRAHAIGDMAIKYVLDMFEEAIDSYGPIQRRHGMEHVNYIKKEDLPRLSKMNINVSTHPVAMENYLKEENPMLTLLGEKRCKITWPVKSFIDSGVYVGTGSDYPCVPIDPMRTIRVMVERTGTTGLPEGGWNPEQKIGVLQALKAYTYGSACVVNREHELGTLKEGMLADIVVFDKDLTKVSPQEFVGTKSILTIVGGTVMFSDYV